MKTRGTIKIFVLCIAFADSPFSNNANEIDSKIFGVGSPSANPYESLRSFYQRSSYNQLDITGNVLGWYTTPYSRDAVAQTSAGRDSVIKDALRYYDSAGHDFSQYDGDADGVVDGFIVLYTGPNNGVFWWAYKTGFSDATFTLDGKRLNPYVWQFGKQHCAGLLGRQLQMGLSLRCPLFDP